MSLSQWKVVPPKQGAWRFFITRALSLAEILPLVRVISISPKDDILVLSSARRAN
jgi:hypothetical protein